jgi:beta-lactamase superfamily II metal-dependent hydrolase
MKPKHRIVMLNVGQGDAFVVQLASGEVIVIDCNRPPLGGAPPTIPVLEEIAHRRGNANIDILCLTHPHSDHFLGMHEVFEWCKSNHGTIGRLVVYLGIDHETTDRLLRDVMKTRPKRGSAVMREFILLNDEIRRFEDSNPSDSCVLGVGAQRLICRTDLDGHDCCVDVVGPLGFAVRHNIERSLYQLIRQMCEGVAGDDGEVNDMSCLLSIRCKGSTVLFTGDSSAKLIVDAWKSYVGTFPCDNRVHIIKMPHHGSMGEKSIWDDSKVLWQQLLGSGTIALLSYGHNNRYKHPHLDVLEANKPLSGLPT